MTPDAMISTSTDDLRSSMECALRHDPAGTLTQASQGLIAMTGRDGMASKRNVLATIIRKATKQLCET